MVFVTANQEEKRLENLVTEVKETIAAGEYKRALRIADSIDYQEKDVAKEQKWDIEREYWVDKVIEEAAKNGIELEYVHSDDIDNTGDISNEEPESKELDGGFTKGFMDAVGSGLDEMKSNVDEFKDNIKNIE